jgi:arylsulfatase A
VNRRDFFRTGAAAASIAAAPPNFVFLISDDHTWSDLGCYGNAVVRTPHLDRLARDGMRFNHCYVSSPQCSPNRSSIFTGCTPHTTATSRLHTPMPEWEPTFLEPLRERGYFAGAFRKVHQGGEFDKRRWNFYGGPQLDFEKFFDALPAGRPFYLHAGFTDPHRPYKPGAFSPPHDPAAVRVPPFLPDAPEVRQDIAHYYDAIARMDADCGRLLDILRRRGIEENTLVIFTGDNGTHKSITSNMNGRTIRGGKGKTTDAGTHVPLVVSWPGKTPRGKVCKDLVDMSDFFPTLMEAAGVTVPKSYPLDGRSFLPQVLGKKGNPREWIYCYYNPRPERTQPVRFARDLRWKLYGDGRLFDVSKDVDETTPITGTRETDASRAARRKLKTALDSMPRNPPLGKR